GRARSLHCGIGEFPAVLSTSSCRSIPNLSRASQSSRESPGRSMSTVEQTWRFGRTACISPRTRHKQRSHGDRDCPICGSKHGETKKRVADEKRGGRAEACRCFKSV